MGELLISKGKFFRDGSEVPIEIGNEEQIKCLKKYEKLKNEFKEGVALDPDFETEEIITAIVDFKCICGQNIHFEVNASYINNFDCFLKKTKECSTCGQKYILDESKNFNLIAKLA